MPRSKSTLELGDLSPTQFENLIYDLVIAKRMVNVLWRTPGADGGRDIEAQSVLVDASGTQTATKWYIECKKYSGSVDWPTIHPKLSYADAAGADYLLLCTTSKFTPQAVNCCEQWNRARRYPQLRLWAGHDIAAQLSQFPDLKSRYGLQSALSTPGKSLVSLSLAVSKAIGSYYSATVSPTNPAHRMLQAAFSMALLLQLRMEDIEHLGGIANRPLQSTSDLPIDVQVVGSPQAVDEPALAAFCGYLSALAKTRLNLTFTGPGSYTIDGYDKFSALLNRYRDAFSAIALWGDIEFTFSDSEVKVKQR